jgi:hypothetical protein
MAVIVAGFAWAEVDYFQQHVAYEIHVTLNDSAHTLSARERLVYTNHSPDTLTFIWFHLWPNAYRNTETAFARQKLESGSTRFLYADDSERGFIDSLDFTVDGQRAAWEFHPQWIDVAKVSLPEPLAPGDSVVIEIPFFVKIPVVFSRLGHAGNFYAITQWYPKPAVYDREGWHPMPYLDRGEFYSEFGTFDVYITLPEQYRIMATGVLVDGDREYAWLDSLAAVGDSLYTLDKKAFKKRIKELSGTGKSRRKGKKAENPEPGKPRLKTLHFHQNRVHDFAWFADPTWIVRKGEILLDDSTRTVTLWSMYRPRNARLWEQSIEYLHDAVYWYSRFYGEYPYEHVTAVDGAMSAGGGMEYPNITVISSGGSKDMLEFVIMHEVGHNWFYGILGSNERDHAWMDEGLNQYSNIRYWEKKYPERNGRVVFSKFIQEKLGIGRDLDFRWILGYVNYAQVAQAGSDQPITTTSREFVPQNYGTIVYGKTAIFTRFLQHYLGEAKMDEAMQDYYETWKFKHPRPQDFRAVFERHVEENLDWYFEDALSTTHVVDYGVAFDGEEVRLDNRGSMQPPVELAFYDREGRELERRWLPGFAGSTTVAPPEGTRAVRIDPDDYLPDIDRTNNATEHPLSWHFVFDQPRYWPTEFTWLPWFFTGNAYNGWTPGIAVYSGFVPPYRYGLFVVPMWDFQHRRPVGLVKYQRTFFRLARFHSVSLSAQAGRLEGRKGFRLEFRGRIRRPLRSTPAWEVTGKLFRHSLREGAVDTLFYTPGSFTIGKLALTYFSKFHPLFYYRFGAGVRSDLGRGTFTRLEVWGRFQRRFTKDLRTSVRAWFGTFVGTADDLPRQYRIYLGGGVDPDFEQPYVFDRTGRETVWANVYEEQFVPDGPNLHGWALRDGEPLVTSGPAWGVNLQQSVPYVPGEIFVDVAGASDLRDTFLDAGLVAPLGPIKIYLTVYQSWDRKPLPDSGKGFLERLRFELSGTFVVGGHKL